MLFRSQLETIPFGELPSAWDIDRTHAGCGSSNADNEDGWGRAQDDWESPIGSLRSRIESNMEMIHNVGYQLEELKETIERLIRIIDPSPLRE